MIYLGIIGDQVYYLKQNPLTKEITLVVNWKGTYKERIYKSKRMILYYMRQLL